MQKIKELLFKFKIYIIIFLSGLILGIIGCWFFQKENIKIIKEEVIKTEYKKIVEPTDMPALWECYKSTININGKIKNNEMIVSAEDSCKRTIKKFKLNSISKKNMITFNYGHFLKTNLVQNFSIMYYRELAFNIGLGCGLTFQQKNNNSDIGWQIGAMYKF